MVTSDYIKMDVKRTSESLTMALRSTWKDVGAGDRSFDRFWPKWTIVTGSDCTFCIAQRCVEHGTIFILAVAGGKWICISIAQFHWWCDRLHLALNFLQLTLLSAELWRMEDDETIMKNLRECSHRGQWLEKQGHSGERKGAQASV